MWYSPSAKKWWLLLRLAHRSFTYRQECDVKRYMKSLADQENAAGIVLNASKDAAICLVSEEQAQKKKMRIDLALSKEMITFETMSRSYSRSKILK